MENGRTETTTLVPANFTALAQSLNRSVLAVIGAKNIEGFEKTYLVAEATKQLRGALTPEYMKPIMELQGSKLGFKSDKSYPEGVVKDCLIEAVLTGVQPVGNQFNIIAGNCYITKEGFGYLLKNIEGLSWEIIPSIPAMKDTGATVKMKIKWTMDTITNEREIDFAIKVNQYMGADAVIGKATRKARAWLHNTITNTEVADGDTSDVPVIIDANHEDEITLDQLRALYELKKDTMRESDKFSAERIINNNETKSFSKLYNQLQPL